MNEKRDAASIAGELRQAANVLREQSRAHQLIIDRAKHYVQADERCGYFIGLSKFRADISEVTPVGEDGLLRQLTSAGLADVGLDVTVVDNPPNMAILASCLSPKHWSQYSILSHLCQQVDHELFISGQLATSAQAALNIAHRLVYMLRIKTGIFLKPLGSPRYRGMRWPPTLKLFIFRF